MEKNPFKPGTKDHAAWEQDNKEKNPKKETPEQKAAREKKEALAKEAEKKAAKDAADKAKAEKAKHGGKVTLRSKTADKMVKEKSNFSNVKSSADVAKEVGRGGFRAGKAGVEMAKSGLRSVHDLTLDELFPGYKKS